jgi:alkanesulfonate monooxygenase
MLEETLRIAKQMWAGTAGPYQGKHYRLEETLCSPQPLTRPHPPILVAGGGEKKTLRLVAQYGDACNIYGTTDEIARKLAALKGHCETLGRDYGAIEKTAIAPIPLVSGGVSVPETRALCRSLAEVGIDHALFSLPNVNEMALLEAFGTAIIPDVATL